MANGINANPFVAIIAVVVATPVEMLFNVVASSSFPDALISSISVVCARWAIIPPYVNKTLALTALRGLVAASATGLSGDNGLTPSRGALWL